MIESLFKILEHSLGIYETKQAREYLDRVIYLKKRYYQEENTREENRNHALMDNIVNELRIITDAVTNFGKPGAEN